MALDYVLDKSSLFYPNLMRGLLFIFLIFQSLVSLGAGSANLPALQVVTENWPPFNFENAQGEVVGTATRKVRKILAAAGIEHSIELMPWARAYQIASSEPNVLIYSIYKTSQRGPLFTWYCPLSHSPPIYLYRLATRTDIQLNDIEGAKSYLIGVMRNDSIHQMLNQLGFRNEQHLSVSANDDVNLRLLLAGRVDLMPQEKNAMHRRLASQNQTEDKVAQVMELQFANQLPNCMALSLNSDPVLELSLRKAFDAFVQSQ